MDMFKNGIMLTLVLAIGIAGMAALTSCGNKGPLYLPEPEDKEKKAMKHKSP